MLPIIISVGVFIWFITFFYAVFEGDILNPFCKYFVFGTLWLAFIAFGIFISSMVYTALTCVTSCLIK